MKSSVWIMSPVNHILAQTMVTSIGLLFTSGPHLAPFSVVLKELRA